jgi:UDP-glucose:(heptosyl)LPS alpha-1,3-glucosyltransferase
VRIALVSESFDPARGGAERCAADLARALAARGSEVTPIFRPPGVGRIAGQRALSRAARSAMATHDRVVSLTRAPGHVLVPQGGVHLAATAGALRPRGPAGRAVGALARLLSPKQWAFLAAENELRAARPRLVALSRMVRDDMIRYWRVDPASITVAPNGVDCNRFAPPLPAARAAARARLGLGEGEVAALLVSHNFALRGLEPLIRALARLDRARWHLVVVGRDRPRGAPRLAARLGVRASFAGAAEDPLPFYHAADLLAHPTFYDPCSLVTLEALACGLPVVTSRWNGAVDLFSGEESRVVEDPRDTAALAAALAAFEPPAARLAASHAARRTALAHPLDRALERLCALVVEGPP